MGGVFTDIRQKRREGRHLKKLLICIPLVLLALISVSPVFILLTGTFTGSGELKNALGPVAGGAQGYAVWRLFPTLRNIVELLFDSPEFFRMFWNSMKITGGILAGQLVFGIPAAWGLAHYDFPGRKVIYLSYMVLMMMPFQVTMLSEYLVLEGLGLSDTLSAVILPGIFSTFPPFVMYRFFCGIPGSLLEAARVDGAGELRIFVSIGIPVGSSGILSVMILQFLECQSMIEQPAAFLKTKSLWPLALYLPEIRLEEAGFAFCASFMALLPALLVFLCGQDYLEQGIAAAAIKE